MGDDPDGRSLRIDPQTSTVAAAHRAAAAPRTSATRTSIGGKVWVPQIRKNTVAVVDPATNTVARTVKAGIGPVRRHSDRRREAWVPSWKGHDIWRIKP